jgi:hypothetical protein
MRRKIYITNGGLGTFNTRIVRYDLGSWQGRRALRLSLRLLANETNKPTWAEDYDRIEIQVNT